MSPEQAQGKHSEVDHRTDQFALGTIVYEMLSGRAPFAGASLAEVVFRVVYASVGRLVPSLPLAVVAAVDRAMQKPAADRFPDVAAFILALTGSELVSLDGRAPTLIADPSSLAPTLPAGSGSLAPTAPGPPDSHSPTLPAAAPTDALAATVAAGPTAKAAPVSPITEKTRPAKWSLAVAAALLAVAAGLLFWIARPAPPGNASIDNRAPAPRAPASLAPAPPPPPAPMIDPPLVETGPSLVAAAPGRTEGSKRAAPSPETLPPTVAAALDEAEQALAAGNGADAVRLARRTLNAKKSGRAFAIITRGFCRQGDLGNAKAQWPHVPAAERPRVLRDCKASGVELN